MTKQLLNTSARPDIKTPRLNASSRILENARAKALRPGNFKHLPALKRVIGEAVKAKDLESAKKKLAKEIEKEKELSKSEKQFAETFVLYRYSFPPEVLETLDDMLAYLSKETPKAIDENGFSSYFISLTEGDKVIGLVSGAYVIETDGFLAGGKPVNANAVFVGYVAVDESARGSPALDNLLRAAYDYADQIATARGHDPPVAIVGEFQAEELRANPSFLSFLKGAGTMALNADYRQLPMRGLKEEPLILAVRPMKTLFTKRNCLDILQGVYEYYYPTEEAHKEIARKAIASLRGPPLPPLVELSP